ncbi:MAG: N-acetylglucosamine-6-phosphate deacetylase [Candidatus Poribacteria bacterium]|nr:N-acetylglucosamine-6-phosphate deacetylase [Candidatus Poribacteria bacterium]
MAERLLITNGKIITPNEILDGHSLLVEDQIIAEIASGNMRVEDCETIDAHGFYVSPGFIDLHIHGGKGSDVMDATPEDLLTITRFHAKGGTTGLLATTAADSLENTLAAIDAVHQVQSKAGVGSTILGIHIEGPYFNYEKKGCHLPGAIRNPVANEYLQLLDYTDQIRLMTLAPEIEGADGLIQELAKRNIVPSCGHSNASYNQIVHAVALGLRHSTHLYCAMSGVIKTGAKREGGIIESTLLMDELTTEVIADGRHLPPELMKLAVKCKTPDRLAVVTDAMRGAGMPDGIYTFGSKDGTQAVVKGGVATMPDNTGYASSTICMNDTIRVMRDLVGVRLEDAVRMASLVPARILGMDDRRGSLEVGKVADIILFDDRMHVHRTIVEGIAIR